MSKGEKVVAEYDTISGRNPCRDEILTDVEVFVPLGKYGRNATGFPDL